MLLFLSINSNYQKIVKSFYIRYCLYFVRKKLQQQSTPTNLKLNFQIVDLHKEIDI
jgi:hypothetical protein